MFDGIKENCRNGDSERQGKKKNGGGIMHERRELEGRVGLFI
jgi:hypothetical protein